MDKDVGVPEFVSIGSAFVGEGVAGRGRSVAVVKRLSERYPA